MFAYSPQLWNNVITYYISISMVFHSRCLKSSSRCKQNFPGTMILPISAILGENIWICLLRFYVTWFYKAVYWILIFLWSLIAVLLLSKDESRKVQLGCRQLKRGNTSSRACQESPKRPTSSITPSIFESLFTFRHVSRAVTCFRNYHLLLWYLNKL